MLGKKIRDARIARDLSLAEVAEQAQVSTATLSRVERDKQPLDLALFLILAAILHTPPRDFFNDNENSDEGEPLVARITAMKARERTALWHRLSEELGKRRRSTATMREMAADMEELLAQSDFLRLQIEGMRRDLKKH